MRPITPAGSDLIARGQVDDENGWFYYDASPTNATQRYSTARLDGTGAPERLTPPDQPGSHRYGFPPTPVGRSTRIPRSTSRRSPIWCNAGTPERTRAGDNATLAARVAPLIARSTEFLQLDIGGGVVMDAWMIKPCDLIPRRSIRCSCTSMASRPTNGIGRLARGTIPLSPGVADLGYVVVSMDNRGTPAPRGRVAAAVFGSLGPLSTEEQAQA